MEKVKGMLKIMYGTGVRLKHITSDEFDIQFDSIDAVNGFILRLEHLKEDMRKEGKGQWMYEWDAYTRSTKLKCTKCGYWEIIPNIHPKELTLSKAPTECLGCGREMTFYND